MTTRLEPAPRSDGLSAPRSDSRSALAAAALPPTLARMPILILYPHARCNCRCEMCDIWQLQDRDELDPSWVTAEVPRWRALGVERVVLSGGEPLMHADLWGLVRPLVDAGIGVTLLSTGLLVSRHAERIVELVDDLVLSLDGPPEVHDAVRRVARAYERLAEGVAAVDRAARASAAPRPRIMARCTVQRANHRSLVATADAAVRLGIDGISFMPVDVSSEAFNRPGGWTAARRAAVAVPAAEVPGLREELAALAAYPRPGFVAESGDKLARMAAYFDALAGVGNFPDVRCNAPWVSAVVEADGTVRPCFFHRAVGRWRGADLPAVVNGPDAVAFRSTLDVAANPICRRCVCSLNLAVDE